MAGVCALSFNVVAANYTAPVLPNSEDRLSFMTEAAPLAFPKGSLAPLEAAVSFVRYTGISKNLSLLLLHDVKNTDTVTAAIQKYGFEKVKQAVVNAIKAEQNKHAIAWDNVLAHVYLKHFDAKALSSIQQDREASPHFITMLEMQDEISGEVQKNGLPVIQAAKASVLQSIAAQFPI